VSQRIVGIDPGLGTRSPTGLAIFTENGKIERWLELWVSNSYTLQEKLAKISMSVAAYINVDDLVCIESTVMRGKGGESLQRLVGAIMAGLPDNEILHVQNSTVKKVVGGRGDDDKHAVARGVQGWFASYNDGVVPEEILNLESSKSWDVLDAFAIGIAGYESRKRNK